MTNDMQLLRPREAAKLLGVSRATLYRMIDDANTPLPLPRPVRLTAQCVAWRESELRDWLDIKQMLGV